MSDAAPEGGSPAKGGRSWLRVLLRVLVLLIIGIFIAAGMLLVLATQGGLTEPIARAASDSLNRRVSLGSARLKLSSPLGVQLDDVKIGNPAGMDGANFFSAKSVTAHGNLNWSPLFTFAPELVDLAVDKGELNIREDANGKSNLDLGAGDSSGALPWPKSVDIKNTRVTYAAAGAESPVVVDDLTGKFAIDPATGKTTGAGQLTYNGEQNDFDIAFSDLKIATAGLPTGLALKLKGPHLTANLSGDAILKGEPQFTGTAKAESGSLKGLASWLSPGTSAPDLAASLDGTIKARGKDLTLDGTDVDAGGSKARVDGTLSFAGERPKLTGNIAMPVLDIRNFSSEPESAAVRSAAPESAEADDQLVIEIVADPDGFARRLEALAAGNAAPVAAESRSIDLPIPGGDGPVARPPRAPPSSGPAWSKDPIDLTALKAADLDTTITADRIAYGDLDITNARIRTKLDAGRLNAKIEDADVGGGKAKGTLAIGADKPKPTIELALDMTGVGAEPVVKAFTGKPFLRGNSDATISVKAEGGNPNALASSLEGNAKFKMKTGAFRGIDIKDEASQLCLSDLVWGYVTGSKKTFKIDLSKETNFSKFDGEYAIRRGVLKSKPDLALDGSEVAIKSRGEVSVARKVLTQNVRLRVIPPPRWPTIPLILSGSWTSVKPKIDFNELDIWALLNTAFTGCKGTRGLAAEAADTPPVPKNVRAAAERVLSSAAAQSVLTEEGRAILRELAPGAPTAPPAALSPGAPEPPAQP